MNQSIGRLSKRKRFSLGSDPEMFVFAENKLIPAYTFLPAKTSGQNVYYDGFQAEWRYDHFYNHCLNTLVKCTRTRLIQLQEEAKKVSPQARLSLASVVRVPKDILENAESRHVELGCMPSFNVYGLHGQDVQDPRKLLFRFAAGHMHFGEYTRKPAYTRIVKMLDNVLGIFGVGAARFMDNPMRRQFYGLPGEYRRPLYPKMRVNSENGEVEPTENVVYGLEYRVLSNFWLASPGLMQLTFDLGRMAIRLAGSVKFSTVWLGSEQETVDTIKNCDYDQATKILNRNADLYRGLLSQEYRRPAAIRMAMDIATQGLQVLVPNPEAFSENWHFDERWKFDAANSWARFETCVN